MPDELLPKRKPLRLPDFSYRTPGAYFVTICTHNTKCLFGEIQDAEMVLNDLGRIAENAWRGLRHRWYGITIDDYYVIMPNHVHGIVVFGDVPQTMKIPRLGDVIARFKAEVTSKIRRELLQFNLTLWHREYYDHIVRDETDLCRIRQYIENNPAQWAEDEYYGLR